MKAKHLFSKTNRGEAAFSLVELMIVVAIIGILASLAVPRFQSFQAKARQAEGRTNLTHIWTLEQAYFGENDKYFFGATNIALTDNNTTDATSCNKNGGLGFSVTDCQKARCTYQILSGTNNNAFTATANEFGDRVLPTCTGTGNDDAWTINQDKALSNVGGLNNCL